MTGVEQARAEAAALAARLERQTGAEAAETVEARRRRWSALVTENARSAHPRPLADLVADFGGPPPDMGPRRLTRSEEKRRRSEESARARGVRRGGALAVAPPEPAAIRSRA